MIAVYATVSVFVPSTIVTWPVAGSPATEANVSDVAPAAVVAAKVDERYRGTFALTVAVFVASTDFTVPVNEAPAALENVTVELVLSGKFAVPCRPTIVETPASMGLPSVTAKAGATGRVGEVMVPPGSPSPRAPTAVVVERSGLVTVMVAWSTCTPAFRVTEPVNVVGLA